MTFFLNSAQARAEGIGRSQAEQAAALERLLNETRALRAQNRALADSLAKYAGKAAQLESILAAMRAMSEEDGDGGNNDG